MVVRDLTQQVRPGQPVDEADAAVRGEQGADLPVILPPADEGDP